MEILFYFFGIIWIMSQLGLLGTWYIWLGMALFLLAQGIILIKKG